MNSHSSLYLCVILLGLWLPGAAQAQNVQGWFDSPTLYPPASRSPYLEPILDFPTDEPSSQLRAVSFEQPIGEVAPASRLTMIDPAMIDPAAEQAWMENVYGIPQYERPLSDVEVGGPYEWTVLPSGAIYKSYLAGVKESRLSVHMISPNGDNWLMDGNLGGRFGVLRYGRDSNFLAEGIQWDVEGSAHVRLDIPEDVDVRSVDFRAGTQLTWSYAANPAHRSRFGYYHLSSHLGDEFVLKNPDFERLNYARDVIIFGHSYYFTPKLRIYGEVGWAFYHLVADPWEFQFGIEWAPNQATGPWGEPFVAIGGHLREELNYGGNLTVQTGWAWVGDVPGRSLRIGMHYYNGESSQYSFFDQFEHQLGFGIWYDF